MSGNEDKFRLRKAVIEGKVVFVVQINKWRVTVHPRYGRISKWGTAWVDMSVDDLLDGVKINVTQGNEK